MRHHHPGRAARMVCGDARRGLSEQPGAYVAGVPQHAGRGVPTVNRGMLVRDADGRDAQGWADMYRARG